MQITYDGDQVIPVEWFFCEDDADILPFPTRFASGNWASSKSNWFGPGEVQGAPRRYKKGQTIPRLVGNHVCGTIDQFGQGASINDPVICTDGDGVSSCCVGESWCCDFSRPPYPATMPVRILAEFNTPPYPFQWIERPTVAVYNGSGADFSYAVLFKYTWSLPPVVTDGGVTIYCSQVSNGLWLVIHPCENYFLPAWEYHNPVAVMFSGIRPLGCFNPPRGALAWNLFLGAGPIPPPPPPPPYFGIFPPGFFPSGLVPPTF